MAYPVGILHEGRGCFLLLRTSGLCPKAQCKILQVQATFAGANTLSHRSGCIGIELPLQDILKYSQKRCEMEITEEP